MRETPVEAAGKYGRGIVYPCGKEQVIEAVERNGGPPEMIERLRASSYDRFTQPSEILAALWLGAKRTPFRGDTAARHPFPGRKAAP